MSNVIFVPDKKTNIYVPLIDNSTENTLPPLIPPKRDPTNIIYNYYTTAPLAAGHGEKMPNDCFIRYYYACLSIIGLFVVYRVLNK